MSITREQWKAALDAQRDGSLTMFISVADFRQFIDGADPRKLSELANLDVTRAVRVVRFLTRISTVISLVAIIVAIVGFRWWAAAIAPAIVVLHLLYGVRAAKGRQRISEAILVLAFGAVAALILDSWSLWARATPFLVSLSLSCQRLLYVYTSWFAFAMCNRSYEWFRAFYQQPEGAMIPMLWTEPELDHLRAAV